MAKYNNPAGGVESSVGTQFETFYYQKKALIEMRKQEFFGQLASTINMPKNFGKAIKSYHYLPILDDANINDEGIDAAGVVGDGVAVGKVKATVKVVQAGVRMSALAGADNTSGTKFFTATDVVTATTEAAALLAAATYLFSIGFGTDTATSVAAALAAGWQVSGQTGSTNPNGDLAAEATVPYGGNLYASSKDVGAIMLKMPLLSENGGDVNNVSVRRVEVTGSIEKYGFKTTYTQESLDFDSDADLEMHINREMLNAAGEMTEDLLQVDLLNAAGVIRLGGDALTVAGMGDSGDLAEITYTDLRKVSLTLDDNRCPKQTKLITGSRMVDTSVVEAARYAYIGNAIEIQMRDMKDADGNKVFISVAKYGSAGTIANGEIGQIDSIKLIVVPEMMHFTSAGADSTTNTQGYRDTAGKFDVFPILIVGSESFKTIGFQTDGKTVKFKIKHSKPGSPESYAMDPYGETGFMSIKWYYGTMITRPERIACLKTLAKW